MKKTAIGTIEPGNNDENTMSVFHSLNPVEKTAAQVGVLLRVVETCKAFLMEGKSPSDGYTVDPDTIAAARSTVESTMHQLRNLIDDMPRWSRDADDNETEAKKLLEANRKKAEAEAYARTQLTRPFFLLRARIIALPDGRFVAINQEQSVRGVGATAAEAADAFDFAFFEQRNAPVPAQAPDAPKAPAPKPRTGSILRRKKS